MIKPFKIEISDAILEEIKKKVTNYTWGYMPDDGGWGYGTNLDYLKKFCKYWVEQYDWRKYESKLNSFAQYTAIVEGIEMHYIHVKGSSKNPKPLLISHGWPGTVAEFINIIEPLAHPERFGGKEEDAFDVIAPSLPGFGFSARPARPMGPRAMAKVLNSLMTDVLGYKAYIAQGGDWGSAICSWIGYDYPESCKAIHINFPTMRHEDGPQTPDEHEWAQKVVDEQIMQDGYRTQQATRPQTLSYAISDSPVGLAAWIVEKFYEWSDIQNDDIESSHSKDDMLTNIMIYLVTNSFNSSTWIYYGRREEGGRCLGENGRCVEVPTGCALFPAEMMSWPPRSYYERLYNIVHWAIMPRGGHFAAMEEPQLVIDDIRVFARLIKI